MTDWKAWAGALAGSALALGILALLAAADARTFEDAGYSELYRFTLDQAYSRFKDSDARVPAGGGPVDPMADAMAPSPAVAPGGAYPAAGGQSMALPGSVAAKLQRTDQQNAVPVADDGGVHTQRGNEHLRAGEYDKAVAEFRLAVEENPARTTARHSLGDALRALNRQDEAIAAYREVLQQNPAFYCCHTHIGDIERLRGNEAAAEKEYATAVEGYTSQLAQGGPAADAARFQLAKLYADLNRNLEQAVQFAEQTVQASPDQVAYVQLLAQLYEKVGRRDEAVALYERLAALNPQYAQYFAQQKQRLQQQGSSSQAP